MRITNNNEWNGAILILDDHNEVKIAVSLANFIIYRNEISELIRKESISSSRAGARLARLQRLQAAPDRQGNADLVRRFMRQPEGAPRHILPMLARFRQAAAAMAVDWCTTASAVDAWLVRDGWAVTPDMLEAAAVRLASRAARYPET